MCKSNAITLFLLLTDALSYKRPPVTGVTRQKLLNLFNNRKIVNCKNLSTCFWNAGLTPDLGDKPVLSLQHHLSSLNLPLERTSHVNSAYLPPSPACFGFLCISTSLNFWKSLQGFVVIKIKRFHTSAVFYRTMGSKNAPLLLNKVRVRSPVCHNVSLHAFCSVVILYI